MNPEDKQYDITVFGATGVTGEYVVEELANFPDITWSIAGRNSDKLKTVLKNVSKYTGKNLEDIDIIIADVSDDASMERMCENCKVLINCVGPYLFFGENVVKYCIKYKTHHLDISAEAQFLETIQLNYFEEAKKQNVYIVGGCGFDSIPCDLGVEYVRKQFEGDMDSVETFLTTKRPPGSTVNIATWQSAIHRLSHISEVEPLRRRLKEALFPKSTPETSHPLKKRPLMFRDEEAWCLPFIGSDKSVVERTQMYNYQFNNEKPVQIETYMTAKSFFHAIATIIMGANVMLMTKCSFGCYLLEKFPRFFSFGTFSRTPPTRNNISEAWFKIIFKAYGWSEKLQPGDKHANPPNKIVKAVLTGTDPAYMTAAICIVNAALVILKDTDKLPKGGGVFTPGTAFGNTSLIEKLEARGIKIAIE